MIDDLKKEVGRWKEEASINAQRVKELEEIAVTALEIAHRAHRGEAEWSELAELRKRLKEKS